MAKLSHQEALECAYAGRMPRENGFAEVPTSLFVDRIDVNMPPLPPVSFYAKTETGLQVIRKADQPYSPLALSARDTVLVKEEELAQIRSYAEGLILGSATGGLPMPPDRRMETLRRSAMIVVEDLFENPTPENIDRSLKVVSSFVYVLMKDPKAYLFLSKLSSHDPYTLQHSVGTAVNSIILARKIGVTGEQDLLEVGMGGLLHDIGKTKVKKEIINKQGPLDDHEWEEMRQHSSEGYEMIKSATQLTERTKRAILEHHEDKHGNGYPYGVPADETHLFSRIVSICDIYNALTTNRSYSKARTPYEAFQFMREKLSHKVDDELFRSLVLIYGGNMPD